MTHPEIKFLLDILLNECNLGLLTLRPEVREVANVGSGSCHGISDLGHSYHYQVDIDVTILVNATPIKHRILQRRIIRRFDFSGHKHTLRHILDSAHNIKTKVISRAALLPV